MLRFVPERTSALAPVSSSTASTCVHVSPPSVVLKSPRSPPGPKSGPVEATRTTSLSRGSMSMRLTCRDSGRPMCSKVSPPSVDL